MTKIPPMPEELRFDHESHVKLWNWLAENPGKEKEDWPEWENIAHSRKHCFACEADDALWQLLISRDLPTPTGYFDTGCVCPLTWPDVACCSTSKCSGLFDKWRRATSSADRARLARQIRDLPVNDNLERAWREIQKTLRRNTPGA